MSDGPTDDGAELLSGSEGTDEDELRLDPLEEGIDPPERWSAADGFGMTANEQREGESLDAKLSEEQPDVLAEEVPDRPIANTPADELDETIDELAVSSDPERLDEHPSGLHTADETRVENADEAGGSVAESIRSSRGN